MIFLSEHPNTPKMNTKTSKIFLTAATLNFKISPYFSILFLKLKALF
ncbi:hypothetical protein HMPREF1139_0522 [Campylobacter sp. FOBRC14]|nr:hypothetical protein HMPREF1139_0522 [Campylobacter sp. FOBRC14]